MGWKFWKSDTSEAERSLERLQSGAATVGRAVSTADATADGPPETDRVDSADFWMVIDDVFSITDRGTIVTGQVASGTVSVGMSVSIATVNGLVSTTVTRIETFRKMLQTARTGENVGLELVEVSRDDVTSGDTITG